MTINLDAIDASKRYEVTDVTPELLKLAEVYAQTYAGNFDYMRAMAQTMARWRKLSAAQAKGVLNCMAAQKRHNATLQASQALSAPATAPDIRKGTYTVCINGASDYVTLKIAEGWEGIDPNTLVAKYLNGSDNENSYKGFAFVDALGYRLWKAFRANNRLDRALQILLSSDLREAGKRYAMISGNCYVCNRTLTTPESIEAGIGPVCAGKEG